MEITKTSFLLSNYSSSLAKMYYYHAAEQQADFQKNLH